MAEHSGGGIDTVMHEERLFPPPAEFAAKARIKSLDEYQAIWDAAAKDPEKFWADIARDELHWFEPFTEALRWNEPVAEWFVGGKTNACYNCVDKHVVERSSSAGSGLQFEVLGRQRRDLGEVHSPVRPAAGAIGRDDVPYRRPLRAIKRDTATGPPDTQVLRQGGDGIG